MAVFSRILSLFRKDPVEEIQWGEDGFSYVVDSRVKASHTWDAVLAIHAWKDDLWTTDTICLALFVEDSNMTVCEETIGFRDFARFVGEKFMLSDPEWLTNIVQPPFAKNYTVLYDRAERA